MKKIKFSNDYEKLPVNWVGTTAYLFTVEVEDVDLLEQVIPSFLNYDTKVRGKDEHYQITFFKALVLFFVHRPTGQVFTTVRRWTEDKEHYYKNAIGEDFVLEVTSTGVTS